MKKKYLYLVLFMALIAFSSCSSEQGTDASTANESDNITASDEGSYELPSYDGITSSPYTSDIPDSFPRAELIPENVEIQSEGSETRNDLNLATISFTSSQSQEELVTFYENAFKSMGENDVDTSTTDNSFSFSTITAENEQIDASGIKKEGETTYLVTVTYYYNK